MVMVVTSSLFEQSTFSLFFGGRLISLFEKHISINISVSNDFHNFSPRSELSKLSNFSPQLSVACICQRVFALMTLLQDIQLEHLEVGEIEH